MCSCSYDAEDMLVEQREGSCFPHAPCESVAVPHTASHCLTCGAVLLGEGERLPLEQLAWGDTTCRDQSMPSAELLFGEWVPTDQS